MPPGDCHVVSFWGRFAYSSFKIFEHSPITQTPLDGQGKWGIESTAPSSSSASITPSLISLLGTGPWIYLMLRGQEGVKAGGAVSLSCPCALCLCKLSPFVSHSESPTWDTPQFPRNPLSDCGVEGLILSPPQPPPSLCWNHDDPFSIYWKQTKRNKPKAPTGDLSHLLFPLLEMFFL